MSASDKVTFFSQLESLSKGFSFHQKDVESRVQESEILVKTLKFEPFLREKVSLRLKGFKIVKNSLLLKV